MKVKATDKWEKLNMYDNVEGCYHKAGEEFEVTAERFKALTHNQYGVEFVEEILEKVETAKKTPIVEKAVKRRKKKTTK